MITAINTTLELIKQKKPLILNITNDVTMDFIANGLLSVGASPIMCKAPDELEDLLKISDVLVINPGTLNKEFIQLCKTACKLANRLNKPIILDPVGAGASKFRTETCCELLHEYRIQILRGNASEIMALVDSTIITKGVDSNQNTNDAVHMAKLLCDKYSLTTIISGKIDYILNSSELKTFERGSNLMPLITGSGCLLTAIISAFFAVEKNAFKASSQATLFYSLCGEVAAKQAKGPGSFKQLFLDALYNKLENV